jgi:hypothetical protein
MCPLRRKKHPFFTFKQTARLPLCTATPSPHYAPQPPVHVMHLNSQSTLCTATPSPCHAPQPSSPLYATQPPDHIMHLNPSPHYAPQPPVHILHLNPQSTQVLQSSSSDVTCSAKLRSPVSPSVYLFQITQLKIASNPFAKGFRDCDPDDW